MDAYDDEEDNNNNDFSYTKNQKQKFDYALLQLWYAGRGWKVTRLL